MEEYKREEEHNVPLHWSGKNMININESLNKIWFQSATWI